MSKTLSNRISEAINKESVAEKRSVLLQLKEESTSRGLNAATDYIEYLLKTLSDIQDEVVIYIFYHSEELLAKSLNKGTATAVTTHESIHLVNLNELQLPADFIIAGTEERINKAMLSEYLGICSVTPPKRARMVGCFTYSVPLKFSREWAEESGNDKLFLPAITFDDIVGVLSELRDDLLYGLEFKSPLNDDLGPVKALKQTLPEKPSSSVGPYKGSFISNRQNFLDLQEFLKAQIPKLLRLKESSLAGVTSKFDSSIASGRGEESHRTDKRRHTYGTSIERFLALYFSYKYSENQMIDLRSVALSHELENSEWKACAIKASVNKELVITFCSKNYLETLEAWLHFYRNTGRHNLFVFSLDQKTLQFCEEKKISTSLTRIDLSKSNLSLLWRKRLYIVSDLVRLGLSVTLTDIDAFWLDDPTDDLFDRKYDIVSSVGTRFPPSVYNSVGKVLCFGLICFHPTSKTLRILDKCIDEFDLHKDDQKCLNFVLKDAGLKIKNLQSTHKTELRMPDNGDLIELNDNDLTATTDCGVRVKLLSHKRYQRLFDPSHRPVVSHLLSPKDNKSKQYCLERINDYPPSSNDSDSKVSGNDSPVIWLASYPRSGNTMMRGWIKNNFLYDSSSIYNDVNDIGASSEMSKQYGHIYKSWKFKREKPSEEELATIEDHDLLSGRSYIKTHACHSHGYNRGKIIYIYRNGLDAIASHVQYRLDFGRKGGTVVRNSLEEELPSLIVNGAPMCGYWSDNLKSWLEYKDQHERQCLVLKFEEIVKNFKKCLLEVQDFSGTYLVSYIPVLFKKAQQLNPKFFRKGSSNLDFYGNLNILSLFYAYEHEGMLLGGYVKQKVHWFCAASFTSFYSINAPTLDPQERETLNYILETSTIYAGDIRPRQIKARNRKIEKIIKMTQVRLSQLSSREDVKTLHSFCEGMHRLIQ